MATLYRQKESARSALLLNAQTRPGKEESAMGMAQLVQLAAMKVAPTKFRMEESAQGMGRKLNLAVSRRMHQ
eukprot:CAMPEP_0172303342 /NCGR_PEP_ID=MMETSP1058-20130122/4885_1 /TAXON_ID=83371 /ORGANISM="Detonula confervacea, Strain CCMP 353" /LENGTH=71 /DNA_ID=CAMNT_0013014111 /DNA_START=43 /DNA_END=258 /DNA_ORIENTATION=-